MVQNQTNQPEKEMKGLSIEKFIKKGKPINFTYII